MQIIARGRSDAEVSHLVDNGANLAIMGEREIALGMLAAESSDGTAKWTEPPGADAAYRRRRSTGRQLQCLHRRDIGRV